MPHYEDSPTELRNEPLHLGGLLSCEPRHVDWHIVRLEEVCANPHLKGLPLRVEEFRIKVPDRVIAVELSNNFELVRIDDDVLV